ncbi:MAG: hypothetical protein N2512_04760 [Armatimonadetes bacterium]|nr:hypothetical protein [Armatimonadota bacterium]
MSENPEGATPQTSGEGTGGGETPKKGRSCGLVTWILILIIGLIVAALIVHNAHVQQQKALQEKAMRHSVRQSQLSQVGEGIAKAAQLLKQGDLGGALDALEAQSNVLSALGKEAASSGDVEDANDIMRRKTAVSAVLDAVRQKQQELQAFAEQQMASLATDFPKVRQALEAVPAASEAPAQPETQEAAPSQTGTAQPAPGAAAVPAQPAPTSPQQTPVVPGP